MSIDSGVTNFFMGSTAPQGFLSYFTQLHNIDNYKYIFILKGASGKGKSEFIEGITEELSNYDNDIEVINCSSDAHAYDGVFFHDLGIVVLDGTAPHILEPTYYDSFEAILSLGNCCDRQKLYSERKKVTELYDKQRTLNERCVRFISAAASLVNDTYRLSMNCTDENKLIAFADRLLQKEIKSKNGAPGKESKRLLTAITPQGLVSLNNTISELSDHYYVVEDDFGAASNMIMHRLRDGLLADGYNIITCCCPVSPFEKLEHIFVPELKLSFLTSNKWHELSPEGSRIIHARRFTDMEALGIRKQRISFNKKATNELLDEAIRILGQAKELQNELEEIYDKALDSEKLEKTKRDTIESILALCHIKR